MNTQSMPHTGPKLPLSIIPIAPKKKQEPTEPLPHHTQPDLTFHCSCCEEYFLSPYNLYMHMNAYHPQLNHQTNDTVEGRSVLEDNREDFDYSCALEPVCELVYSQENTDENSSSDSSDDDDDSSTTSSSDSSNSSSNTSSNSNSISVSNDESTERQDGMAPEKTQMAHIKWNANESSQHASTFDSNIRLKTNRRESTSIISFKPKTPAVPIQNKFTCFNRTGRGNRTSALKTDKFMSFLNGDRKCFQCSQCDESFQTAGDLSKHVRMHITNKPFQCSICAKTFTHIGSLNTHIRIHSGEKPYKCKQCSKAFTQSSSLMVHLRSHSVKKPFHCGLCDKGFINSNSLMLHSKSHVRDETFACPECEREFKHEFLLDEHMRMHTQDLVYQCSICRTAFRTSSELVQHMKNHLGEKPFTCSICDRSFTQSGSLNIHMRIHTGERPFRCTLCEKSFTQASSLGVHMRIHTGEKPHPCYICGKSYSQQAYLNKHMQAHMDEKTKVEAENTLLCIVCGCAQEDITSLAKHLTEMHVELMQKIKVEGQQQPKGLMNDFIMDTDSQETQVQNLQYMLQLERVKQKIYQEVSVQLQPLA